MTYHEIIKHLLNGKLATRELFYGQFIQYNPFEKKYYCYDFSTEDGSKFEYIFTAEDIDAKDWKIYK